jgi:hypothetical protein
MEKESSLCTGSNKNYMNQSFRSAIVLFLLTVSISICAQKRPATVDSTIYSIRQLHIQCRIYTIHLKPTGCYILNAKGDTVFEQKANYYFSMRCLDFNGDGFPDIFLDKSAIAPGTYDLLLYDPSLRGFRKIEDFDLYPDPKPIKGTKFYYSYRTNGCADLDWISYLFYMDDFQPVRIGEIHGYGCDTSRRAPINIYRINGNNRKLVKTMLLHTSDRYKMHKWGFIKRYWSTMYLHFVPKLQNSK